MVTSFLTVRTACSRKLRLVALGLGTIIATGAFPLAPASSLAQDVSSRPASSLAQSDPSPTVVETLHRIPVGPENWSTRRYQKDMVAHTRRLDRAEDLEERLIPVVDLCGLYLRIVADTRFGKSEVLQGYRGRIAARLQQTVKDLKKRDPQGTGAVASSEFSQYWGKPRAGNDEETFARDLSASIMDPHWQVAAGFCGGACSFGFHADGLHGSSGHFFRGMMAGEPFDNGPELVALIEAILHPEFWSAGGGSGVLHYYRPFRVLVVRATVTVHEDLASFLERLR